MAAINRKIVLFVLITGKTQKKKDNCLAAFLAEVEVGTKLTLIDIIYGAATPPRSLTLIRNVQSSTISSIPLHFSPPQVRKIRISSRLVLKKKKKRASSPN